MFGRSNTLKLRLSATLALIVWLSPYAVRPVGAADMLLAASDKASPQPAPQEGQPQVGAGGGTGTGTGTHQTVIAPPSTGDAAINKGAPPQSQFPTPVIQPPKSPDSPSTATPKN